MTLITQNRRTLKIAPVESFSCIRKGDSRIDLSLASFEPVFTLLPLLFYTNSPPFFNTSFEIELPD